MRRKLFDWSLKSILFVCPVILALVVINSKLTHHYPDFVEDNDLWMEDDLNRRNAGVTEDTFHKIVDAGRELYTPVAEAYNEKLTINALWDNPTVNANCSRSFFGSVTVNMYGGMARRPEISPEGFALVLCHELGHAYGGAPYINSYLEMSAEGQADYYGAKECLNKVLPIVWQDLNLENEPSEYALAVCYNDNVDNIEGYQMCVRQLYAGERLGHLLSVIKKEETIPSYETPDPYETPKTLTSYPATVQCRQDTYFNGALKLDRPKCWYKE